MKLSILSDSAKSRRRRAIGRALAASREGTSQTELGIKLGAPQTTVSRWERGTVDLTLEQALEIEVHLGLTPGTLARAGGYVASDDNFTARSIEEMLRSDTNLDPDVREDVIGMYRSYVQVSHRLRRTESLHQIPA